MNRYHPLSTYTKFSEKLTFLTLWYVRVRIRGLEMLVFRKILRAYLMDDPIFNYGTHKAVILIYEMCTSSAEKIKRHKNMDFKFNLISLSGFLTLINFCIKMRHITSDLLWIRAFKGNQSVYIANRTYRFCWQ